MQLSKARSQRTAFVTGIMLLIAAAHVIGLGRFLAGPLSRLHSSYFSDLVLPFGCYLLLCQAEGRGFRWLKPWTIKAAAVFLLPAVAETLQYLGVDALGVTFDPLDYLAYAIGSGTAALVDIHVFSPALEFWRTARAEA